MYTEYDIYIYTYRERERFTYISLSLHGKYAKQHLCTFINIWELDFLTEKKGHRTKGLSYPHFDGNSSMVGPIALTHRIFYDLTWRTWYAMNCHDVIKKRKASYCAISLTLALCLLSSRFQHQSDLWSALTGGIYLDISETFMRQMMKNTIRPWVFPIMFQPHEIRTSSVTVFEPIPKKRHNLYIYISIYQSTHVKTDVKYIKGTHVQHRLASEDWVPHSIDENHHVPYHLMIAPLPFGE